MSADQDSVPALQREVAKLWEAYRRGAEQPPAVSSPEDDEALRGLEARHAALLQRRDVLRAARAQRQAAALPGSAVLGALASVVGTVLGAALSVWSAPVVAGWSAGWAPELGLGLVAASLVGLVISLRRG